MSPDIQAQAWSALSHAWALRWALIIGVGSLPSLVAFLGRKLGRIWTMPRLAAQACALFAVLTCIYSLKLLPDTYRLESEQPDAVEALQCEVVRGTDSRRALRCVGSEHAEQAMPASADALEGLVTLYRLPSSGLLVGLRVRDGSR